MLYDRKEDIHFIRWAKAIKSRDNYRCQICDEVGGELHAHHLYSWHDNPDVRYDLTNGVTLCRKHHDGFHKTYGYGSNYEAQFIEYKTICKKLDFKVKIDAMKEKFVKTVAKDLLIAKIKSDLSGQ